MQQPRYGTRSAAETSSSPRGQQPGHDAASPQRHVHMVGNAHLDPVWLWRWPEGYQEARATFWSAIQRMNEYPDFVFTCDQVVLLSWVEESDPALFEAIRERVAEGRWVMVGGWWVEPDCNLPTGESFVRQGLYGQRYLAEKFGVTATVGLNADPFGHHAMLPQILRKQGMTAYCFLRPGPHEAELPGPPFWWEAPDGSRVLAYRIPHEYCSPRSDVIQHTKKALAQLPPEDVQAMVFYGVGNHGGGPTRANIDSIQELDEAQTLGALRLSSPEAYFAAVGDDPGAFPVWREDLQHHAAGCYAAHSGVKGWMRRSEHALLRAEKWASVAAATSALPYPLAELTHAWKQVLFNQFHDILPGTSIEPAYEDARDQLGEARSIAGRVLNRGLQVLARDVDIPAVPGTQPVLVFNVHPWPVRTTVEVEFNLFPEPARVEDETGAHVPVQPTRPLATVNDPKRRRLAFEVDLPPLGYRLYTIAPDADAGDTDPAGASVHATINTYEVSDAMLENAYVRIEVDPHTGAVSSLVHKASGIDLAGARHPRVVVSEDHTDTWGHRVVHYNRADHDEYFRCRSVRLVENGPLRSVLRVESAYGTSCMVEEFVLDRGARAVEVRTSLDWHEQLKLAKLRFRTRLTDPVATYEIPYGHLQRPADGAEEPGQSWVDVTGTLPDDTPAGLTVLNDAKAAYDVDGCDVAITIARSPVYAWHDPRELEPEGVFSYQDQGSQSFRYLLVPHTGDWREAGVVRSATELNQPPVAMAESFHAGTRPRADSFASASAGSVVPAVLKCSEDGPDQFVLRAYESAGRSERATLDLQFLSRSVEADFAPNEIKTFVVPVDNGKPIAEADLLEHPASFTRANSEPVTVSHPEPTAPAPADATGEACDG